MRLHIIIYIALISLLCFPAKMQADNKPFVVVLDAGHGGKDPGTIGSSRANREKDIVLNITLEVGRMLRNNCPDVKLIYTRDNDRFVELYRRAEIANKAKADLFVSIHVNALPKRPSNVTGVQTYTLALKSASTNLEVEKAENSVIQFEENGASRYGFANDKSAESDIMFELMQDRDMKESVSFAEMVQKELVHSAGRTNMGVQQANLAVLRLTYMPSVLVEVGFISNPNEERYMMSSGGQQALAKSIYNAIVKYKTKQTGRQSALEKITPQTTTEQPQAERAQSTRSAQNTKPTQGNAVQTEPVSNTADTQKNTPKDTPKDTQKDTPEEASETFYRVQILSGDVNLGPKDRQFKGLTVDKRKDGKIYKYTYGKVKTMQEANKLRKSILDKFPGAFVVKY